MTEPNQDQAPYRILVAVGGDDTSSPALVEAVALSRAHERAELHVVHVIEEKVAAPSAVGLPLLEKQLDEATQALRERLKRVGAETRFGGRIISHLRIGSPAPLILQVATDLEADLIVVSTHHRTGLDRFFLGSVAESVVRHAHCPVLMVTAKNYDGLRRSRQIAPPCPECVKARAASQGKTYWCAPHSQKHTSTEVFEFTDRTSLTPPPTGMRIV